MTLFHVDLHTTNGSLELCHQNSLHVSMQMLKRNEKKIYIYLNHYVVLFFVWFFIFCSFFCGFFFSETEFRREGRFLQSDHINKSKIFSLFMSFVWISEMKNHLHYSGPVTWGSWIRRLHFCRGVRPSPNYLMNRLQFWIFEECRVHL